MNPLEKINPFKSKREPQEDIVSQTAAEETAKQAEQQKPAGEEQMEQQEAATDEKPEPQEETQTPKVSEVRKRYMYAASDDAGNILLDQGGRFCFRAAEGDAQPNRNDWPVEIRARVAKNLTHRVEIEPIPEELNKDASKKGKKKIKEARNAANGKAKQELRQILEEMGLKDSATQSDQAKEQRAQPEMGSTQEDRMPEMIRPQEDQKPETNMSQEETKPKAPEAARPEMLSVPQPAKASVSDKNEHHFLKKLDEQNDCINRLSDRIDGLSDRIDGLNDDTLLLDVLQNDHRQIQELIGVPEKEEPKTLLSGMKKNRDNIISAIGKRSDAVQAAVKSGTDAVSAQVDTLGKDLDEKHEKLLGKAGSMSKQIRELGESVETMEGSIKKLNQLDKVTELLESKGMVISMDIPPVNAEEEDIVNMVLYSQKITEQLGYAARELMRKAEMFRSQEEKNANEQAAMENKLKESRDRGFQEGQLEAVKKLIRKYADIDALRLSDSSHVHAVWSFLEEMGVEIDGGGRFEKGQEIELSEEEVQRMLAAYPGISDAGRYQVTRTGLVFCQEVILKAEFERMPKEEPDKQPAQPADHAE